MESTGTEGAAVEQLQEGQQAQLASVVQSALEQEQAQAMAADEAVEDQQQDEQEQRAVVNNRSAHSNGAKQATLRQAKRRYRLTERDLELVRWLGRVKLARAEQVALRFSMARSKTYARLQALCAEGLVRSERRVPGACVFLATRAGLALCGLPLGEARMSLATLNHDLAVAEACAQIELNGEDLIVVGEREMRQQLQAEGDCPFRTRVRETAKGRAGYHWPDLVAHRDRGAFVAVEVELSQKRADRTKAILSAYSSHGEALAAVLYLTPEPRFAKRLAKLADQQGLGRHGTTVFRSAALSEAPDFSALLAGIRAERRARYEEQQQRRQADAERQAERERAEEQRRRECEERDRRRREAEAERQAEERKLSRRLRRSVLG